MQKHPYKLYTFYRSSTAWRVRIALNLKHTVSEYVFVHLFKGEQRNAAYQNINPNMGVPTLQLPDGTALIESMAILEYLDEVHPDPNPLFPRNNPVLKAQIRGFCEVINSGIHPYQNLRLLEKIEQDYKGNRGEFAKYWVKRGMDTIEKMASKTRGKYVFGDQLSAADVLFYPQVLAATTRFGADIRDYKNSGEILENLKRVKEFVDAEPQNQPDFEK